MPLHFRYILCTSLHWVISEGRFAYHYVKRTTTRGKNSITFRIINSLYQIMIYKNLCFYYLIVFWFFFRCWPKTLWQFLLMLSSIIVCQTQQSQWPMLKTHIILLVFWRKPLSEIYLEPKICMRFWVTEKASLDPCRFVEHKILSHVLH